MTQQMPGQISSKPTTLMGLRAPSLQVKMRNPNLALTEINQYRDEKRRGHAYDAQTDTSGINAVNGQWRTSPLKEYPPSMSKGIALAIVDSNKAAGHLASESSDDEMNGDEGGDEDEGGPGGGSVEMRSKSFRFMFGKIVGRLKNSFNLYDEDAHHHLGADYHEV